MAEESQTENKHVVNVISDGERNDKRKIRLGSVQPILQVVKLEQQVADGSLLVLIFFILFNGLIDVFRQRLDHVFTIDEDLVPVDVTDESIQAKPYGPPAHGENNDRQINTPIPSPMPKWYPVEREERR